MEDILILKDKTGGTAVLTVCSPMSHYAIPVLRIESEDISDDFGPADLIDTTISFMPGHSYRGGILKNCKQQNYFFLNGLKGHK